MESVFSDSSDTSFGDLSLSCSFSPVEEHRQTPEVEASKSLAGSLATSTEGDGDSLGGGRLGNSV